MQLYPECNPFRFAGLCGLFTGNATSELSVGDRSRLVVSPRRAHTKMRFVSFAVLSSGLRNERKYEQKERPCSSIRNAIRSGFLAFAVYLPETATSELSVGDRSRLVVSSRRAHTKMRLCPFQCCHRVCATRGSMSRKRGLAALSGMQSVQVFWPLRSIYRKQQQASSV